MVGEIPTRRLVVRGGKLVNHSEAGAVGVELENGAVVIAAPVGGSSVERVARQRQAIGADAVGAAQRAQIGES